MALFDLKCKLETYGLKVNSTNADCLNVINEPEKLNKFKTKNKYLFDYDDKNSYSSIGKFNMAKKFIKPNGLV
jgi:hypothetical protein